MTILVPLFSFVSHLAHVVEAVVRSHNFEANINVEKDSGLFHYEARVKAWPDLNVVGVQAVSVLLIETLLPNGLKLEAAHHRVEEDLQEIHVILVGLLHDLHPLDCDLIGCAVMLSLIDWQFSNFLE